jgi:serine/threonine-protein kinase HipA
LAPFYDLLSTVIYPELSERLAMKIGGEDRPKWIIARSWQKFSEETGIGFKIVKKRLLELGDQMLEQAELLKEDFANDTDTADNIIVIIRKRIDKVALAIKSAGFS